MSQDDIEKELGYVRLSEGLLVLQNIDIIMADICVNGDPMVRLVIRCCASSVTISRR